KGQRRLKTDEIPVGHLPIHDLDGSVSEEPFVAHVNADTVAGKPDCQADRDNHGATDGVSHPRSQARDHGTGSYGPWKQAQSSTEAVLRGWSSGCEQDLPAPSAPTGTVADLG